jgi:2-keto-3-deoxy-L-rhamnonate aldolase RhmA
MIGNQLRMRALLASGRTVLGSVVFEFGVSVLPSLAREAGVEFLFLDMEHSSFDLATVRSLIDACRLESIAPLVRVPSISDEALIGKVLDFGAAAVMGPMIGLPEDARRLVRATRYPPDGVRGAGYGRQTAWREDDASRRDAAPLVVAQIESAAGLSNLDQIASVDGVDVLWVGQRDLSLALGVPGRFDSERFLAAVARVARAATAAGKAAGYVVETAEQAAALAEYGYRCFAVGSDVGLYRGALSARIGEVHARLAEHTFSRAAGKDTS